MPVTTSKARHNEPFFSTARFIRNKRIGCQDAACRNNELDLVCLGHRKLDLSLLVATHSQSNGQVLDTSRPGIECYNDNSRAVEKGHYQNSMYSVEFSCEKRLAPLRFIPITRSSFQLFNVNASYFQCPAEQVLCVFLASTIYDSILLFM